MSPRFFPALFALCLTGRLVAEVDPGDLLDNPGFPWILNPPGAGAALSGAAAHDGTDALALPMTVAPVAPVRLETTVDGPAVVTWWWRRDNGNPALTVSGAFDFFLNGVRLCDHDDGKQWEKISLQLPAGAHALRWQAVGSGASGESGVLDEFTVEPGASLPEGEAMDEPGGIWMKADIQTEWERTTTAAETHDGADALTVRSAEPGFGASLRRVITGPARVSWWWRKDASGGAVKAKLRSISPTGGSTVAEWVLGEASPTGWERVWTAVPPGAHLLNFRYESQGGALPPSGAKAAFLDEFHSAPTSVVETLGPQP